jgi:hypothetical protein
MINEEDLSDDENEDLMVCLTKMDSCSNGSEFYKVKTRTTKSINLQP